MKRRRGRKQQRGLRRRKVKNRTLEKQRMRRPDSGKREVFGFMADEFKIVGDVESVLVPLRQGKSNVDVREKK